MNCLLLQKCKTSKPDFFCHQSAPVLCLTGVNISDLLSKIGLQVNQTNEKVGRKYANLLGTKHIAALAQVTLLAFCKTLKIFCFELCAKIPC